MDDMNASQAPTGPELPVKTLREWREEQGRSFTWIAMKSAVTYPSVMFWIRAGRFPEAAKARIAAALGIRPEQIAELPDPALKPTRRATDRITPDQISDTTPTESTEAPAIVPGAPRASAEAVSERRQGERRKVSV